MPIVAIPHLEEAVAFKCRLWLNDYLGVAERLDPDPAIKPGVTARPADYVRADNILDVDVKQTPAVCVGLRGFENWHRNGTELWADAQVEVAVRFGTSARTAFDVGVGPRIYLTALGNLFDAPSNRDLGAGIRVTGITDAGLTDATKEPNGTFSLASLTLSVPAPFFDSVDQFLDAPTEIPLPGDDPREPDEPLTILDLITSVEKMP